MKITKKKLKLNKNYLLINFLSSFIFISTTQDTLCYLQGAINNIFMIYFIKLSIFIIYVR
jgi:hypothetical protein